MFPMSMLRKMTLLSVTVVQNVLGVKMLTWKVTL